MASPTSVPYDWLRHIPHSLLEQDEIPILSSPGPFPWERLTALLAKTFQLEKFVIEPGQWDSRSEETLLQGLGNPAKFLNIELSPLPGTITWAMSEQDLNLLMSLILTREPRASDIIDKDYQEGFFEFVALEALLAFNRSDYDKGLVPHIIDTTTAPHGSSLCFDITFSCSGTTFLGRLMLSEEFRHAWKDRYAQHKMNVDLSAELADKLQVIVHLEAGKTVLSYQDWQAIQAGDYLPLDSCTLESDTDKGRVMITLQGKPLFRAKVKQGNIKILEFPHYQEVDTIMSTHDEDEDTDEYFDESEIDDDSEFQEDDDEFAEEDEFSTEEHSLGDESAAAPSKKTSSATKAASPSTAPSDKAVSPENIPMTVVVEVGRLQMSIQKLMELEPGNLLELDVHPENGVDLVVNGKCIGRGELLRIGDTLGVRVLDKG